MKQAKKLPPYRYSVEITKGYNGATTNHSPVVLPLRDAQDWLAEQASLKCPNVYKDIWTINSRDGRIIVDFGSHLYFGRIVRMKERG